MGKRKEERRRIAAIINRYIDELQSGKQLHHWDAKSKPTTMEREGRIKLLEAILREVGHKEAGGTDDQDT